MDRDTRLSTSVSRKRLVCQGIAYWERERSSKYARTFTTCLTRPTLTYRQSIRRSGRLTRREQSPLTATLALRARRLGAGLYSCRRGSASEGRNTQLYRRGR